jgi:hypothetical protein
VLPAEPAVTIDGRLLHRGCAPHRDLGEDVLDFLRAHRGHGFCHTCLTSLVGMDFDDVRKTMDRLRARRRRRPPDRPLRRL